MVEAGRTEPVRVGDADASLGRADPDPDREVGEDTGEAHRVPAQGRGGSARSESALATAAAARCSSSGPPSENVDRDPGELGARRSGSAAASRDPADVPRRFLETLFPELDRATCVCRSGGGEPSARRSRSFRAASRRSPAGSAAGPRPGRCPTTALQQRNQAAADRGRGDRDLGLECSRDPVGLEHRCDQRPAPAEIAGHDRDLGRVGAICDQADDLGRDRLRLAALPGGTQDSQDRSRVPGARARPVRSSARGGREVGSRACSRGRTRFRSRRRRRALAGSRAGWREPTARRSRPRREAPR